MIHTLNLLRKVLKCNVIIIGMILICTTGCKKQKLLKIEEVSEVDYINNNKDNISSVIIHKTTIGSNDCYNVDIETAIDEINQIKIIKKSNISVTDNYLSYTFKFNDKSSKSISFEGKYLIYNKESYVIDNFPQIELNEEDIIECQY